MVSFDHVPNADNWRLTRKPDKADLFSQLMPDGLTWRPMVDQAITPGAPATGQRHDLPAYSSTGTSNLS